MFGNHFHKGKLVDPGKYNSVDLKGIFIKFHNDLKTESLFVFEIKGKNAKSRHDLLRKTCIKHLILLSEMIIYWAILD